MFKQIIFAHFLAICVIVISLLLPMNLPVHKNGEHFTTRFMLGYPGQIFTSTTPFANWIPLEEISPALICSVIKAEDRSFFKHSGIDISAIGRALAKQIQNKGTLGASTITQQLAKNLLGNHDRTWANKIREAWYTIRLELHLSKEEILEYYLNSIEWGIDIWGIKQASQNYFHKMPDELTLAESIYLASIIANPRSLNDDGQINRIKSVYKRVSYQLYISELLSYEGFQMVRSSFSSFLTSNNITLLGSTSATLNKSIAESLTSILDSQCGLSKELVNEKR